MDGCQSTQLGPLIVMGWRFKPQVESWVRKRKLGLKFGTKADADAAKRLPIMTAMLDLPRYDFFPIFWATPRVILHPPSSPPNGCPVSRSMSWTRRRP